MRGMGESSTVFEKNFGQPFSQKLLARDCGANEVVSPVMEKKKKRKEKKTEKKKEEKENCGCKTEFMF